MLDPSIVSQLKTVFERLEGSVELELFTSGHDKQAELADMLTGVADTSPKITVRYSDTEVPVPSFTVHGSDGPTGIRFTGVPGGHEFTSVILAILNADGKGKQPDEGLAQRIARLKGPVRVRTVMSLSCENCPDVVQALNLMASNHPDFEHETVDGGLIPDEIERLQIRGVPAVLAGDTLISSGKAGMADLIARLEGHFGTSEAATPVQLEHVGMAVIGGGPAGASAAIYAARKGMKVVVVTDRMGGQLQDTKGIENLISVPYTEGPQLSADLQKHMDAYDIGLLEHRKVTRIEPGRPATLTFDSGETLTADAVVIATGAKWRELNVPGEREYLGRGVAFCPHCDGPMFKGKPIAVVGGGNSGVEAALDLAGIVEHVTVLEFAETPRADAVLLGRLAKTPNATLITNAATTAIEGDGSAVHKLVYTDRATDEQHALEVDGVFVQIGLVPNSAFVAEVVKTNRFGEIEVDGKGRTSVEGIYAAGDVTTVPYKQIVVALGQGASAGLAAHEDLGALSA